MQIIERIKSPYNDVDVWETDSGIDFEVAGGTHATWDEHRILTDYAWDAIAAAALLRAKAPPRSLLMLGLGGGTAIRQLRHFVPSMRITAVEIDPSMVDLARRYMQLDELNVEVVVDDAYDYITACTKKFDAVVDDVYMGGASDVFRPKTHNASLMDALCQRLTPGGILLANLVTGSGHRRVQSKVRAAFKRKFGQLRIVKPMKGFNETLIGGPTAAPSRLKEFECKFTHPRDIAAWDALSVRTLG
ncbi:MAG: fused MFS/spermidine synthase [Verrucomicrobia bacterium]|nr:fused MFS/spermidine synthase [Verrucomicrobiota bacterium]